MPLCAITAASSGTVINPAGPAGNFTHVFEAIGGQRAAGIGHRQAFGFGRQRDAAVAGATSPVAGVVGIVSRTASRS